jgi:hypothetical protein
MSVTVGPSKGQRYKPRGAPLSSNYRNVIVPCRDSIFPYSLLAVCAKRISTPNGSGAHCNKYYYIIISRQKCERIIGVLEQGQINSLAPHHLFGPLAFAGQLVAKVRSLVAKRLHGGLRFTNLATQDLGGKRGTTFSTNGGMEHAWHA